MENKKNYPSLPSNYVTLARLHERWLKEQERKQNEEQLQQQRQQQQQEQMLLHQKKLQQREPHQQGNGVVVFRRHGTASGSRSHRPKIRNDSRSNSPAIGVSSEDNAKLEANAEIGDENADLNGKGNNESKNKKKKKKERRRKLRVDKERGATTEEGGAAAEATTEGNNKEAENSSEDNKRGGVDQETTIKTELNHKNSSKLMRMEVKHKFGALSMSSVSGKQNSRLRRVSNGFHHSQSQYQRNYGDGGGFHRRRQEAQKRRGDKMVWVRKDCNVGGIENSTAKYT